MDQRLHGGILNYEKKDREEYLDYSVNINPLGMPDFVREAVENSLSFLECYPDPECRKLCRRLAEIHELSENQVVCGNGAADLIYQIVNVIKPRRAMVFAPTFSEYELALGSVGCEVNHFFLLRESGFVPDMKAICEAVTPDLDLIFFCNPNNPTGISVKREEIAKLADRCEQCGTILVIDECFQEFLDQPELTTVIPLLRDEQKLSYRNLIVLRAFTKIFAVAGLRLGYLLVSDSSWKERLRKFRQPWNVSLPAQEAGYASLGSQGRSYVEKTRQLIRREREKMRTRMEKLGYLVYPSEANFLFFEVPWELSGKLSGESCGLSALFSFCMKEKILIRDCSNYKGVVPGSYRVCVRTEAENERLLSVLEKAKKKFDR